MNNQNELYHHGVIGQKWGVRRYQNEDGTLTEAGRIKYTKEAERFANVLEKALKSLDQYQQSVTYETVANRRNPEVYSIYKTEDLKKRRVYNKNVVAVNKLMDRLDKKGYDWRYDSNYDQSGRIVDSGKSFVEATIQGIKIRREWD